MTGALANIYSETLLAQAAMQRMAHTLPGLPSDPALWNEVEDALEAALTGFMAFRATARAIPPRQTTRPSPSPGLAGV